MNHTERADRICRATFDTPRRELGFDPQCPACGFVDGRLCRCTTHQIRAAGAQLDAAVSELHAAHKLVLAYDELGPRARRLIVAIAERLVKGAREHGDFPDAAKRNWTQEALDEDLDQIVYRTVELQERQRQGR